MEKDDFSSCFPPLAERLRPRKLEEFMGQEHILGPGKILRKALEKGYLSSMIFWGPPGSGKTTLALLIANVTDSQFIRFSAVTSGVKELRGAIAKAQHWQKSNKKTILFVDEIHRFNKAQQDALLPYVENGTVTLIGATTENPSFEVIAPLLSRARVFTLKRLEPEQIKLIIQRALKDTEIGLGIHNINIDSEAINFLAHVADGDARRALGALELAFELAQAMAEEGESINITTELCQEVMQQKTFVYDKDREEHYNLISALHKSLRGSDPDAALYWTARMLEAGEDPLYVARRMVRFAVEDIGTADPMAMVIAIAARDTYHFLGSPEGDLALAEAAVYLATAPKSAAIYKGYGAAVSDAKEYGSLPVPMHIRNAPTGLMKGLGYGKGYKYAHDDPAGYIPQEYLPEKLIGKTYYKATGRGFEKKIEERLKEWQQLKKEKQS